MLRLNVQRAYAHCAGGALAPCDDALEGTVVGKLRCELHRLAADRAVFDGGEIARGDVHLGFIGLTTPGAGEGHDGQELETRRRFSRLENRFQAVEGVDILGVA